MVLNSMNHIIKSTEAAPLGKVTIQQISHDML